MSNAVMGSHKTQEYLKKESITTQANPISDTEISTLQCQSKVQNELEAVTLGQILTSNLKGPSCNWREGPTEASQLGQSQSNLKSSPGKLLGTKPAHMKSTVSVLNDTNIFSPGQLLLDQR